MGDPVPVRVAGPRTVVWHCPSTRIPLPSHAAAAACLSTSGPPAVRHPPRRALSSSRTRQGPLPVPHDTSRHDLVPATPSSLPGRRGVPPAPWRPSWPSVVRLPPRATANVAYGAMRCVDRVRCCVAARHWRSSRRCFHTPGSSSRQRRLWRPMCAGPIPPRHHAGINDLVSTTLGATGRKAAFAPRHYRIPRHRATGRRRPLRPLPAAGR